MTTKPALCIIALTGLSALVHAATITGKVVDTASRPVTAFVTISQLPTSLSAKPGSMFASAIQAAADGTFSFADLPPGAYMLCAQVPKGTLINPCQWTTAPPPHLTLSAAASTASITLTMRPGYRIPIRIDDPHGMLNAHEGKTPGAHLLVGVHGGYRFEAADIDSTDSSGRNLSVLVPFDAPVAVSFQGGFFKLQDSAGNAVNKGIAMPVTVASAAPSAKLNIKVIGTN